VKSGIDVQEDALKAGGTPGTAGWGCEQEESWGLLNTDINDLHFKGKIETLPGNYLAFYDNIYDHMVKGKPLAVKPEQAAEVIKIILAVKRSNEQNKTIRMIDF
jgi:predicted dehydrogenase